MPGDPVKLAPLCVLSPSFVVNFALNLGIDIGF